MVQSSSVPGPAGRSRSEAAAAQAALNGVHLEQEFPLTSREETAVEDRQDEIISEKSVDGNAPTHEQRTVGWRLLGTGAVLILILGVVVAMLYGTSAATVLQYAGVMAVLLVVGGMPVWTIVNRRGVEERTARERALAEHVAEEGGI